MGGVNDRSKVIVTVTNSLIIQKITHHAVTFTNVVHVTGVAADLLIDKNVSKCTEQTKAFLTSDKL